LQEKLENILRITFEEEEKIKYLLKKLKQTQKERKALFQSRNAPGNISSIDIFPGAFFGLRRKQG